MKIEFAIWMVSYFIRRGSDTQRNIINEWSKYINEDVKIDKDTFGNNRKNRRIVWNGNTLQSCHQEILHRR